MWMIDFLRILLFLTGKVIGVEVVLEWEISGSGTKFGCGSMQPPKIWRETFLLADLEFARAISQVNFYCSCCSVWS